MKFEKEVSDLSGPYSAIFTPFDSSGEINFDMLTAIANANGIRGFFATGSTGEGLLLSFEERAAVYKHLVDEFGDRATIIAHVGHPSADYAVRLAGKAADAGVHWIASLAPIVHGTTFEGAMRHYSAISAVIELPFMIYALDGMIDARRDTAYFDLPNVCGLKFTGANFYSAQQLARFIDRPISMMSGFDEQLVAALSFGFQGGIGSTYNFAPQFYARIYSNYHAGNMDQAVRLQSEINQVTELMVQYENWSYRKAIMKYIGFDCGPARAPYAPLTNQEYETFSEKLADLNVLSSKTAATRQETA